MKLAPGQKPRWYDPAARTILFYYSKANGLGFSPHSLDCPIMAGGDYDGMLPCYTAYIGDAPFASLGINRDDMTWFYEFVMKLKNNEDFSLDELIQAAITAGFTPFTRSEIR